MVNKQNWFSGIIASMCIAISGCSLFDNGGGLPPPTREPTPGETAALNTIDTADVIGQLAPVAAILPVPGAAVAAPIGAAIDTKGDALRTEVAQLRAGYDARYKEMEARWALLIAAKAGGERQVAETHRDDEARRLRLEENQKFWAALLSSGIGLLNVGAMLFRKSKEEATAAKTPIPVTPAPS